MMGDGMKEFQFERKQRFSLRPYAIGACSVLLGTSLFFCWYGCSACTGYRNEFSTNFKSLFGWAGFIWKAEIWVAMVWIRKQAFELMGVLGYYEGFVPYVSNQYKNQAEEEGKPLSDKYIFEKILGKTYAAFKKDQINERVEKLGKLKPITINYNGKSEVIDSKEKLQELMNKAVKDEVAQI